jgi:CheY-like chemotaxis protein
MIDKKAMPRILVVDDETQFSCAASFALRMAGFKVAEAGSGKEGLDMLLFKKDDGEAFDLVLVDLIMPRMTGLQMIDKMRELKIDAKILIITGVVEPEILRGFTSRGCRDVLFKPFSPKEMVETVERMLGRSTAE